MPKLTFYFSGMAGKSVKTQDIKRHGVDGLISYNEFTRKDCVDRITKLMAFYVRLKRASRKKK